MTEFNAWLEHWEPIWLFVILALELVAGVYTAYMVTLEFWYDANKDLAKKQRRTKISKKTTSKPGGEQVVEETTETEEPTGDGK